MDDMQKAIMKAFEMKEENARLKAFLRKSWVLMQELRDASYSQGFYSPDEIVAFDKAIDEARRLAVDE